MPPFDPPDLTGTFLADLPAEVAAALFIGAQVITAPAGAAIFLVTDPDPRIGIVLRGTARSYLTAADGRQFTVRYARRGSLVGKRSDLSGDHTPLSVRAVTDCEVLVLDVGQFARLATTEISLSSRVNEELARRLEDVYSTVADTAFGSMRQRVVRHVLALAEFDARERRVASVSQQQLADGIGTSREVVARVLRLLREDGLIQTSPREIEILDSVRLASFLGEWRSASRAYEANLNIAVESPLHAPQKAVVAIDDLVAAQ